MPDREKLLLKLIVRLFPTLPPDSRRWLLARLRADQERLGDV